MVTPVWKHSTQRFDVAYLQIKTRAALLNETTARSISYQWPGNQTTLQVPAPTRAFKIDISQPLLNAVRAPNCSLLLHDVLFSCRRPVGLRT